MIATELPGERQPYLLLAGDGERWLIGAQLATVMARNADTGGLLEAIMLSGGRGAGLPTHRHPRVHEVWLVLDGRVSIHLAGRHYDLTRGDYVSIPPGTAHRYEMTGHHTKILTWTVGGDAAGLCAALGSTCEGYVAPPDAPMTTDAQWAAAVVNGDVQRVAASAAADARPDLEPPEGAAPYVLAAGEGQRLVVADQLFTFLGHRGNSDGRFITLGTYGPRGERIPMHLHEQHTETFFCVDGAMTMWVNGQQVELHSGDFLHAPAGTVHSYRLDARVTQFVGVLAPAIFEPFFRLLGDPYEPYVFPLQPWPFRFDRVGPHLHELDLKFVEDPRAVPTRHDERDPEAPRN